MCSHSYLETRKTRLYYLKLKLQNNENFNVDFLEDDSNIYVKNSTLHKLRLAITRLKFPTIMEISKKQSFRTVLNTFFYSICRKVKKSIVIGSENEITPN